MQLGRFKPQNWSNMLKERAELRRQGTKFSMSSLLTAHHISGKWCKYIDLAVDHFKTQKRVDQISMQEFYLVCRDMYDNDHPTEEVNVPAPTKEVRENPLEKASLEDLIKEINRRGFKVAQV